MEEKTSLGNMVEERNRHWEIARALQAASGYEVSEYLDALTRSYVAGVYGAAKLAGKVRRQCEEQREAAKRKERESDLVASNMLCALAMTGFSLTSIALLKVHSMLFEGVLPEEETGVYREETTEGQAPARQETQTAQHNVRQEVSLLIEGCFEKERAYKYGQPLTPEDIDHLSEFIDDVWSIQPFEKGNARTISVFMLQYMKELGIEMSMSCIENGGSPSKSPRIRSNSGGTAKSSLALVEEVLENASTSQLDICETERKAGRKEQGGVDLNNEMMQAYGYQNEILVNEEIREGEREI